MFRGLHMLRAITNPEQQANAGNIVVQAVFLYEDGVGVHFVILGDLGTPQSAEEAQLNPMGNMALGLTDDVGTEYAMQAGSWGGGSNEIFRQTTFFSPAVPEGARRLTVMSTAGALDFELA